MRVATTCSHDSKNPCLVLVYWSISLAVSPRPGRRHLSGRIPAGTNSESRPALDRGSHIWNELLIWRRIPQSLCWFDQLEIDPDPICQLQSLYALRVEPIRFVLTLFAEPPPWLFFIMGHWSRFFLSDVLPSL